uniref:Pappalysin-1 n=1 Tax=Astyanax mexicanus TaxID=7994 RepID=A0A8B9JHB2_ASTMX
IPVFVLKVSLHAVNIRYKRAIVNSSEANLRLRPAVDVPRGNFTLSMWVKPEGGQRPRAVIAGLFDKCFYASSDRGWILGIKPVSEHGNRDPRFFFSLKTDRAHKVTSIHSSAHYLPGHWAHVAITYDDLYMKLFVNGAQTAVSREQSGDVFCALTKKCKVLMLGGNALSNNYRGSVERVTLWRKALSQRQVVRDMHGYEDSQDQADLVIRESFEHPGRKWLPVKDGSFPQPDEGPRDGLGSLDTTLEPPACGQTVCDNVEVVHNYNRFWSFRRPKTVRYRVVNVFDDERRRPTVTDQQIHLQHQHLNEAFAMYNITWELTVHNVSNSSLRCRLVLANCDISKVGDEDCDPECNHTLTGFDAGYCKPRTHCPNHKQKNGVCDPECNWDNYEYDNNDCCNPNVTDVTKTCINPASSLRYVAVLTMLMLTFLYALYLLTDDDCTDSFTLNQVARMHCYLDLVYQTWQPNYKPSIVPMPPHVVHQGQDSITVEWFPPLTGHFYDREVGSVCDKCAEGRVFLQYASHSWSPRPCLPSGHWSPREAEGPPDVEQVCEPSVRTWSPHNGMDVGLVPPPCPLQGCMLQLEFAFPVVPESLTVWVTFCSPEETALPAIQNIMLLTVGGHNISLGPSNVFCDTPLTLKLDVKEKVYGVQFFTMEQHLEIDATMLTSRPDCPLCQNCEPLRYRLLRQPAFSYGPRGVEVSDAGRRYVDRDVKHGVVYTYQVQTLSRWGESEPSPPLSHRLGVPYCGDGIIQRSQGEQCDDMNSMNGDGCSSQCKKEPFFNCVDEPSMCYYYDGDGVCEDFERETSVKDCGLYTPSGFLDQWATSVEASHEERLYCPADVAAGYPAITKTCQSKVFDLSDGVSQYAWFPCREAQQVTWYRQYWLKAYFSHPMVAAAVIIHLAADGTSFLDQTQCNMSVQLVDTKEKVHNLGDWRLSCRNNPLVIPVNHDLSMAFYHTKAILLIFRSELVAVSGVALRSFQFFDPITISGCQSNEIYNPMGQSCVHYSCEAIDCPEPKVRNAELRCSGGFFNGARCTVTCNSGYVLQVHRDDDLIKSQSGSTVTMTCTDGKWNKQVSCEPVDCGLPDKYHVHPANFHFSEGTTYGKKCTFQCREPAQLVGTNNTLTCMEDGLWSFPEALCELRCPAPPPVPNAVLMTKRCNETGLKVGSLCKYKCKPGYHVTNKSKRRSFKRQCTEDGRWLEGACEPVTCPPPPPVFHGMYQCTDGFRFDSTCWLHCHGSNRTDKPPLPCKQGPNANVIRCRKDGNWTGDFRVCPQLKGQCALPRNLNPSVFVSCRKGYGIGGFIISCHFVNNFVVLFSQNSASLKSLRTEPPSIICTMGLKWYPHPEVLHCIRGCEPFQGDNYCDAMNNRAYCNYDGGDCCHSTVKTKKVILFPSSCDVHSDCACRDPNAPENRKGESMYSLG